jgi:4-hydroxyphenylpyruvate dioxygenase-like putative hemolysin
MRIDHIAYRVKDRHKTVEFFKKAFGYRVQTEFEIKFEDKSTAKCFALEPPEKPEVPDLPKYKQENGDPMEFLIHWTNLSSAGAIPENNFQGANYHLAPEIFVSDGTPDSIVGKWVKARGDIGGIHHVAYQVDSVAETMKEWREKGYAEFTTEDPLTCPGLTQCFTKPSELTGVIYEFIERESQGFCKDNVKDLMNSTKELV